MQIIEQPVLTPEVTEHSGSWVICTLSLGAFGGQRAGFLTAQNGFVSNHLSPEVVRFTDYNSAANYRTYAAYTCTRVLYPAYVTDEQHKVVLTASLYASVHAVDPILRRAGVYFVGYSYTTVMQDGDRNYDTAIPVCSYESSHAISFGNSSTAVIASQELIHRMTYLGGHSEIPPGTIRRVYFFEGGRFRSRLAVLSAPSAILSPSKMYVIDASADFADDRIETLTPQSSATTSNNVRRCSLKERRLIDIPGLESE